ncbi:MAG: sigma-54 dependent transcriptional regulator [Bradymonadales bacterium]|jgi:two-component system response regulator PilR (NtrC family)
MSRILLVDDEASLREMGRIMLSREGYDVDLADGVDSALARIDALLAEASQSYDLVLSDLKMGEKTGLELLREVHARDNSTQVLIMTAYATTQTAVEAMRLGAYDYIEKPFKRDALLALVAKALEKRELLRENHKLRQQIRDPEGFSGMIGRSPAMRAVYEMISRIGASRTNVLITGESGTGKELVARAVHDQSSKSRPFIAINCGAIAESLVESEFFGYVKGAFTGANANKQGFIAAANGGTLFLDEVGELPMSMQVKLLRVLQEHKFTPVGSTAEQNAEFSVICATHRDLREEVDRGRFRADLYYRLNVIQIDVPPLRERLEDIPLLVSHFIKKYAKIQEKPVQDIEPAALQLLMSFDFPGNIRELENIIERAVILEANNSISPDSLPQALRNRSPERHLPAAVEFGEGFVLETVVEDLERSLIDRALEQSGGNRTQAAKLLGISFRALRYRLKKYGYDET